jgi:hypothetical protein
MNKLNLKNEILTASNMLNIKGGDGEVQGRISYSDPLPKPPPGGAKPGSPPIDFGNNNTAMEVDRTQYFGWY